MQEAALADGKPGGKAVSKMIEGYVTAGERDFTLICRKADADGAPDRVLETLAQQQRVRCAEAVVVVAA